MIVGRLITIVGVMFLLSGCVTTRVGDLSDKEEAAKLNLELGLGYLRQGDFNEARIKLEKSIKDQPDNATAQRALGLVYERLGDNKGAEKQYRTAVSKAPEDVDTLNQLASFLCAHDERPEALKLFDQALSIPLYPNRELLLTNLATCISATDKPQAEVYLRQALALKPNYGPALLQMGEVSYSQQHFAQARAFVSRYIDSAATNSAVLWLGYRVEVALRDLDAANDYAVQLLKRFPDSAEAQLLQKQKRDAG
jgi:type IV pilus assembly protein PilF